MAIDDRGVEHQWFVHLLEAGNVGTLAGMPVYVSNRMKETTTNNHIAGAIFRPDNAKLLYQIAPKVVSQYSVDFLGTKVAAYVACGFDFVRDGEVIVLTQTA